MEGYRTGKFPNGAILVDEGVFTRDGDGRAWQEGRDRVFTKIHP